MGAFWWLGGALFCIARACADSPTPPRCYACTSVWCRYHTALGDDASKVVTVTDREKVVTTFKNGALKFITMATRKNKSILLRALRRAFHPTSQQQMREGGGTRSVFARVAE